MDREITITSANSLIGRELLDRLAQQPTRPVALVRRPADLPATSAMVTDWTSSPQAVQAINTADAVVHLSGEIAAKSAAEYDAANVRTTQIVADALRPGQRVVFVSYLGADPGSGNAFLRAKGRAEQLLLESPAEAVVLRTQVIAHPLACPGGFEEAIRQSGPRAKVRLVGDGRARVRPIAQAPRTTVAGPTGSHAGDLDQVAAGVV